MCVHFYDTLPMMHWLPIPCLQLPFELGIIDVSAVSVTTGVLSVAAVLPVATMISFLFRLREVKQMASGNHHARSRKTESVCFEGEIWNSKELKFIFNAHLQITKCAAPRTNVLFVGCFEIGDTFYFILFQFSFPHSRSHVSHFHF